VRHFILLRFSIIPFFQDKNKWNVGRDWGAGLRVTSCGTRGKTEEGGKDEGQKTGQDGKPAIRRGKESREK